MMPTAFTGRNQSAGRRYTRWSYGALRSCQGALFSGLAVMAVGCSDRLELAIVLEAALDPDPFDQVSEVRVVGLVGGRPQALESLRWDQGPVELTGRLPVEITRFWVEGTDAEGRTRAAAMSPPVDFVSDPIDEVRLTFAQLGALSVVPGTVEPRQGYRATTFGTEGVLLLGGALESGDPPTSTVLIDRFGALREGPPLPGGRVGAAVATTDRRVVVWGGAPTWVVLEPGLAAQEAPNPFEPGPRPVALSSDARQVTVIAPGGGEVGELEVVDLRGRPVGTLPGSGLEGAAFARLSAERFLVVGGMSSRVARIYDTRSAGVVGRGLFLDAAGLGRTDAAVAVTSAMSAVLIGGGASEVLQWDFGQARTGTVTPLRVAGSTASARLPGVARLYSAGGGRLLAKALSATVAPWRIDLAEASVRQLPPFEVGFDLAAHPDGTLRGVADDGRLLVFSPGPGAFAPDLGTAEGIIPRPPGRWRRVGDGVLGSSLEPASTTGPQSWAILGEGRYLDFDLEVQLEPVGRGRAAILISFDEDGFDFVTLERSARLVAGPGRPRIDGCPPADVPELDEGAGTVLVRLDRSGRRVRLRIGGRSVLVCNVPSSRAGRLGLSVLREQVQFSRLRLAGELR